MSHIPYYNQPDTEGKKVNKNGYEIRAEVVAIAKDYIEKQHKANLEYVAKMTELGQKTSEAYVEALKPYTFEQILEHANKIYEFIVTRK